VLTRPTLNGMGDELYSVDRDFRVSVERLWRAWTSADELEQWYCPTALSVVPGSVISEPQNGGVWAVAIDVPMHDFVAHFYGRYLLFEPFDRIEHTLHYTRELGEFLDRDESTDHHLIVLEFASRGSDLSWVQFTQVGDLSDDQVEATRDGTLSYFDNLERFLAREPV